MYSLFLKIQPDMSLFTRTLIIILKIFTGDMISLVRSWGRGYKQQFSILSLNKILKLRYLVGKLNYIKAINWH